MVAERQKDADSLTIPFMVDPEEAKGAEAYDLSLNGNTSFFKTTFNGLNALTGIGILSVPYALASGGWLSLIFLFFIASVTFYTGLMIKRCMDFDPNIKSYQDIGERAFGVKGRIVVSVFVNIELYLVTTGFLILAGDNLHMLLPNVEVSISGIVIGGQQTFVLLVALVVMPTLLINKMTNLSYVSATGVVASVVVLGLVSSSGLSDDIGYHQKGELLNWSGMPTALSLYALCYCAHPVFPTLYTSMRNRRQFSSVLFLCFLLSTITNAVIAIIGYLMFGSELQSQITLNLPTNKLGSKVAIYTALVNPIVKYAFMLRPVYEAIESHCGGKKHCRILTRSMLLGSSVVVALTLPFYGYLMSLTGAFTSVTSTILIPCLCYLKISGAYREFSFVSVIIGFSVLMGLLILVIGTYTSLAQIMQDL